ncbi:MAG: hypothetical protein PHE73_03555 [Sulfurovaceae bacterium]|nr:hypothetical protein [Sulfurovaceae bacterium]
MTEELKFVLLYRILLTILFFILSSSFLILPLGWWSTQLFRIAAGFAVISQSSLTLYDIYKLDKAADDKE